MSTEQAIRLVVNGKTYEPTVSVRTTLVDLLRGGLHLTGTHVGCEHGVCGACTVLLNGQAVRSCLMLAVQADGAELVTVEGLAGDGGELHPIQEAFVEEVAAKMAVMKSEMDAGHGRAGDNIRSLMASVRAHHVSLDPTVMVALMSMMVLEGWQFRLDPGVSIVGSIAQQLDRRGSLIGQLINLVR